MKWNHLAAAVYIGVDLGVIWVRVQTRDAVHETTAHAGLKRYSVLKALICLAANEPRVISAPLKGQLIAGRLEVSVDRGAFGRLAI